MRSNLAGACVSHRVFWIPAFAAMTVRGFAGFAEPSLATPPPA